MNVIYSLRRYGALGVSRKTISEVVLEQRPITVDMAMRLGRYFGNGAGLWLNMQQAVDLWAAVHSHGRILPQFST